MGADGEWPALTERQKSGDGIYLAICQNNTSNRAMAQMARPGVKLRCRDNLLAQIRRGVDQKPVFAVGADRNRGLGRLQFRLRTAGRATDLAITIPLRNTTARRSPENDDAHKEAPRSIQCD